MKMQLIDLSIKEFCDQLASDSPAPGGGSVAALACALSVALCTMVTRLTMGKKKYERVGSQMTAIHDQAEALLKDLLILVDKDTDAYNQVMAAVRLPRDGEDEKTSRKMAIEAANREAARVPLNTLRTVAKLIPITSAVIKDGNANCITDAGVAVHLMHTAALGAAYNVKINLDSISDAGFVASAKTETDELIGRISEAVRQQAAGVEKAIE
jgi:formiminotetrahydrofolate cyclodeaminase